MSWGPPTPLTAPQIHEVQKEMGTFLGHLGCCRSLRMPQSRDFEKGKRLPLHLSQLSAGAVLALL